MTSSMPAASAFFLMPSSTFAQKVMPRSRLAKASTYFSPFLGGAFVIASVTAAARFSADSISPEKPVALKPWKSCATAVPAKSAIAPAVSAARKLEANIDMMCPSSLFCRTLLVIGQAN
jgi:hypothetical protein